MKKQHIDFIIWEEKEERLIFRFYPRRSSCHSFNEKPPKTAKDIYKVYFSYAILEQNRWNENNPWETERVFDCYCDECSIIDEVAYICKELSEGKTSCEVEHHNEKYTVQFLDRPIFPFGYGVEWTIKRKEVNYGDWDKPNMKLLYTFYLFDYRDIGYRFNVTEDRLNEFGDYLQECCDYMLEHGDPI